MIDVRAFIRAKRDGRAHAPETLRAFVADAARGAIPDYQVSAWLMAAFLNGLDAAEIEALTRALMESGRVFDWSALGRPSADKHSTGGVGDKVSLVLAPVVAACGTLVPMVSGRGLGHTGGTLDKLESIPGFRTQLSPDAMRAQLDAIGVVMVGQGPDLAPADGLLYALRDATSTVERRGFIVPSIVSKKVAEGADAIVYDVKCGSGAFMTTRSEATTLARELIAATQALGRRAAARVTDMSQPLGQAVGNALEVREAADVLQGGGPDDVRALSLELSAVMLALTGTPAAEARRQVERAIASGAAWEKWLALVEAQGGDRSSFERAGGLPAAPVIATVTATRGGTLESIDGFALGELVVAMGGGRAAKDDPIDPAVGLKVLRRIGERVAAGEPLAELHLRADDPATRERAGACFQIGDRDVAPPPLVLERLEGSLERR